MKSESSLISAQGSLGMNLSPFHENVKIICMISLKGGHQVLASRPKSRGVAVLVGAAGYPSDCPNSGWVDQAWGQN